MATQLQDSALSAEAVLASATDRAVTPSSWWMVFVLFTFYLMSFVDRTIIAHLVDPIKAAFDLGDFQMSLILGPVFAISFSVAALPAGWLVDRFDRRLVAGGAMMFWSLMTIACGFAPGLLWLMAARALLAAGEAMLTPVAYALIADRFPKDRLSSALAFYNMGAKAGTSVAFFVAAAAILAAGVIASGQFNALGLQPWQIVFVIVGAPGLVLAFLPLTFGRANTSRPARDPSDPAKLDGLIAFIRRHAAYLTPLFAGIGLVAIINGALAAWLPSFMQRTYGWSATQYGPPLGVITALAAILTLGHGVIVDRLYKRGVKQAAIRYFTWLVAAAIPVGGVAFFLDSPWLFLICLGALYILVMPYALYFAIAIQMITPSHLRGRMTGFMMVAIPIFSQGLGPMVIGGLTDFVYRDPQKIGHAFAVLSIGGLVGALLCLRLAIARADRPAPANP